MAMPVNRISFWIVCTFGFTSKFYLTCFFFLFIIIYLNILKLLFNCSINQIDVRRIVILIILKLNDVIELTM